MHVAFLTRKRPRPIKHLNIQPIFDHKVSSEALDSHIHLIEKTIQKILPDEVSSSSPTKAAEWMKKHLPFIKWTECRQTPDCLTIYLLSPPIKEIKTQNFFIDLLKRWLLPDKEVEVISHLSMHFQLPGDVDTVYFVAEANVLVESGQDLASMQKNLPLIAKELISGIQSWKYAKYVLETKNLLYDRKVSLTNQDLIRLLDKRPNDFDFSVFTEINRFLALTDESFREQRPYRHITRLACSLYLLRKNLKRWLNTFPEKRHLYLRFIPTTLSFTFGDKPALGLIVGVNLFDQHEFFGEKHIVAGIKKYLPNIQAVKNTFYSFQEPKDNIRTIYFEIEKTNGKKFSLNEISFLKKNLTDELKGHIETLTPTVFVTRNEEEIMRNILILSRELKYVSDLPQVNISFDFQSVDHLTFTIVLVRIYKPHTESIEKIIKDFDPNLNITIERTQTIGFLRKKYPKEVNVLRLKIKKTASIIRKDSSVNLLFARKKVLSIIQGAFGEVRDFNGGMLLKQGEVFSELNKVYQNISISKQDLLESFFYSINPIEVQTRLSLPILKNFAKLFLDQLEKPLKKHENFHFDVLQEKKNTLVMIRTFEPTVREEILQALGEDKFSITSTYVHHQGIYSLGFIFQTPNEAKKQSYIRLLKSAITKVLKKTHSPETLRINCPFTPISLDPRIGGDEDSKFIISKLFEGLVRIDKNGKVIPGIAKSYRISEDNKTYLFKLRKSFWSNNSEICAYDFEYAWKKILSPEFSTPFTFVFYPIINAIQAKKGNISLDEIGIKAIDNNTLLIKLEYPAPYFLHLLSLPLFSPINHRVDKMHPNWSSQEDSGYVCNGPFTLNTSEGNFCLQRNPLYWNQKNIPVEKISLIKSGYSDAISMFNNNELNSLLVPNKFSKDIFINKRTVPKKHKVTTPNILNCLVFNVNKYPFHNVNIRKALSYAINKTSLIKKTQLTSHPAYRLLTNKKEQQILMKDSVKIAQSFFLKGLEELNISLKKFPTLTLVYPQNPTMDKVAKTLKETWKESLGIECRIEGYEWKTLFRKLTISEYQFTLFHWTSAIDDPMYTLNWFRYKDDLINFSNWESKSFQKFLNIADHKTNSNQRKMILRSAENLLLQNVPVLPLFNEKTLLYRCEWPNLKNSDFFSDLFSNL